MTAPDIFLSYNREDQATAQRFAEAFEAQSFSVWWDVTLRSGEAYDQVTEKALREAKAVVVLWSKRSVESRWVRAEATLADRNRTLVPARIEPCDLPIMFELTQTADLTRWQGEANDTAWRSFLADVRRFVGAEATAEPAPTPSRAKPSSRGTRPSIAVLPFVNRSGVSDDDIFADAMVDDLTAALSVSRRMKVIASSATAAYRQGARDLRQIGRDLGVRYLLEGNVRRVGSNVRVTAQLVEAEDGDILWTQKFDRELAELSALQEELATEVAACLGVEVQRAEMDHALRKPGDITAWEAIMRAEAHLARQTLTGMEAAVKEARRAIAIDPDYDAAYAVLAISLGLLLVYRNGGKDDALAQEIRDTVARARAFESNDPTVLARIGTALAMVGRVQEALPFAERAVALNPNLDSPHIALGNILARLGRFDAAITEFSAADRVAPNGVWAYGPSMWRSVAHLHAGRLDQALEAAEQAVRLNPAAMAQTQRIICLARLERTKDAQDAMRRLRDTGQDMSWQSIEYFFERTLYYRPDTETGRTLLPVLRKLWDETEIDA